MGDRTDRAAMVNSLASRGSERTHPAFQLVVIPDADVPSGMEDRLGRSDRALILIRKIWERELQALQDGNPLKEWKRTEALAGLSSRAND